MKVHELAAELGMTDKDLLKALTSAGIKTKSHLDVLDPKLVERVRAKLKSKSVKAEAKPVEVKEVKKVKTVRVEKKSDKPASKETAKAVKPVKAKKSAKDTSEKVKTPLKIETKKIEPKTPEVPVKAVPVPKAAPVSAPAVKKEAVQISPKQTPAPTAKPPVTQPVAVKEQAPVVPPKSLAIQIKTPITVGSLAEILKLRPSEMIKHLIEIGIFANINQLLNDEIVFKVAGKLGLKIEKIEDETAKIFDKTKQEDTAKLKFRPPVVTMMGHVDHGKTSLLDAIRKSNVVSGEAGHITQHIGAYMVDVPGKGHITFLDTPGHEAFTAIRARGAKATDLVVLVVAADDGVMPQTIEAIDHARAAGCPILVAINKSDLPAANPQRVMTQLQRHELVTEEWGGKTVFVKVSAKTGEGIDDLLDMLLLESEVLELKANPDCAAQGTVLEARLAKNQGPVATMLIQRGTLKIGDALVAGPYFGNVRAMRNDRGKHVKEAGLSYAVEVLGLSGVPDAGQIFAVVSDEKVARQLAEKRAFEIREHEMKGFHSRHLSLQELYSRMKEGQVKELRLIIKADVQGSLEGITQTLTRSVSEKINVRVIHGGVGGVNESDVMLAVASDAIIIGFHVKAETRAQELIEKEGIDVRFYSIIYEALDDIKKAMEGMLEPTAKEVVDGKVEIRQVFKSSKAGNIGGATVLKGKLLRNHKVRLVRDNIVVFEGKLASLKRFKDDVREVQEGYECGLALEGHNDIKQGDIIEAYRVEKTAGKLV